GGQRGDDVVVQRATEGARGVDVDRFPDQHVGVRHRAHVLVLALHPPYRGVVNVGDHHVRAVRDEMADQVPADLADAGDPDPAAGQRVVSPQVPGAGAHTLVDAEGGEHRGVPGSAVLTGAAGDVAALPGDQVHVARVGADIARGDVAAVQRLHEPAVGTQQRLGLVPVRVPDDHGFAAAEVQVRECGFIGHSLRQ